MQDDRDTPSSNNESLHGAPAEGSVQEETETEKGALLQKRDFKIRIYELDKKLLQFVENFRLITKILELRNELDEENCALFD